MDALRESSAINYDALIEMLSGASAFLSYARTDDADRRVTALAELLEREVRVHWGRTFELYRDQSHIGLGQPWQARIFELLEASTLFIPILTPGFFESAECRQELTTFLAHRKKRGREDLVVPILYVTCPLLDDPEIRSRDPLVAEICRVQRHEMRSLRHEDTRSPELRKSISALAEQIRDILNRTPPSAADAEIRSSTASKSVPREHVVDASLRGDFEHISDAIACASPGDRIRVKRGLYREVVVLDKVLEIVGDGLVDDVIIEAHSESVLVFRTTHGRVENITLRQLGSGQSPCVAIEQGQMHLEQCHITSTESVGVAVYGDADPRIRKNQIHDSKRGGVLIDQDARGLMEDNDICSNKVGIDIRANAAPILRRNRISKGEIGVLLRGHSQAKLVENEIVDNDHTGVEIADHASPVLQRNRVQRGKSFGIFAHGAQKGMLEDNQILGNFLSGVVISERAHLTLRRNRIENCKHTGIIVDDGSSLLEENHVLANRASGLSVRSGGKCEAFGNSIVRNQQFGIVVGTGGAGIFDGNDLRENGRGPWSIDPAATTNVECSNNKE